MQGHYILLMFFVFRTPSFSKVTTRTELHQTFCHVQTQSDLRRYTSKISGPSPNTLDQNNQFSGSFTAL